MKVPKIKYVSKLPEARVRKRDGEVLTHYVAIALTTDEALELSQYFTLAKQEQAANAPTYTLARMAILQLADMDISEDALLNDMAKWRARARLAEKLSDAEYNRALSLLSEADKPKSKPKPAEQPKPISQRRVYIPPPLTKKRLS